MDDSAPQQDSEKQQANRFWGALRILDRIEHWLTSIFEITEEEQSDAGVYLGNQDNE